jgi:hypothetical protein
MELRLLYQTRLPCNGARVRVARCPLKLQDRWSSSGKRRWRIASTAHSHTEEVDSTHAIPVAQPEAVVKIIEQAAQGAAR